MGMGEHVRMTAAALRTTDVEFGVINVRPGAAHRELATLDHGQLMERPRHRANVLHVNADQTLSLYGRYGRDLFADRYSIGYWAWELSRWPQAWKPVLELVHEVWAPSRFIAEAVGAAARVPVIHMPLCVSVPDVDDRYDRAHFGLDREPFHFLYTFDFLSFPQRKNPQAAVQAFGRAFPRGDEPARLVLKTMNASAGAPAFRELAAAAATDPRILLMNRTLSRAEVVALASCCDAFVSLHRSEGFGRGPAEAMALGRPVVVTAYSGTMDFTTPETACLVDFRLVPVAAGDYPMHEDQVWAEPDVDHAAAQMRRLFDDPAAARAMGQRAQAHIERHFGQAAVGRRYAARLRELHLA
jgi:glycosyltransferase involved in cell wall biosynthesis